jgi:hypothetical protein
LLGRFNADQRTDAVRFQMTQACSTTGACWWITHDQAMFVGWDGIRAGFNPWTGIAMR